jgi:hypothetical protein
MKLTIEYNVVFDGEVPERMDGADRSDWLAQLEAAAHKTASMRISQTLDWAGNTLAVLPEVPPGGIHSEGGDASGVIMGPRMVATSAQSAA